MYFSLEGCTRKKDLIASRKEDTCILPLERKDFCHLKIYLCLEGKVYLPL